MWDIAKEFKAMLIFGEHRYYGQSLPYGSESFKVSYFCLFVFVVVENPTPPSIFCVFV
jgi:hypothetical protein